MRRVPNMGALAGTHRLPSMSLVASLACAVCWACGSAESPPTPVVDSGSGTGDSGVNNPKDAGAETGPSPDPGCSVDGLCLVTDVAPEGLAVGSLSGNAPDDVWAAGAQGLVAHWDGTTWDNLRLGDVVDGGVPFFLRSVWAERKDSVWFTGGGIAVQTDGWKGRAGTRWAVASLPRTTYTDSLSAITYVLPVPTTAIRAIGDTLWISSTLPGVPLGTFRTDGDNRVVGRWSPLGDFPGGLFDGFPVRSLASTDSEVWAVGDDGRVVRFTAKPGPDGRVNAPDAGVVAPRPSHWDALELESQAALTLQGVYVSPNSVWVVGNGGAIRRLNRARVVPTDTATLRFEAMASPTSETLRSIHGTSDTDIWAAGDNATVLHYDGTAWRSVQVPYNESDPKPAFSACWASSTDDAWFAGDSVLHFRPQSVKGGPQ